MLLFCLAHLHLSPRSSFPLLLQISFVERKRGPVEKALLLVDNTGQGFVYSPLLYTLTPLLRGHGTKLIVTRCIFLHKSHLASPNERGWQSFDLRYVITDTWICNVALMSFFSAQHSVLTINRLDMQIVRLSAYQGNKCALRGLPSFYIFFLHDMF